MSSDAQSTIFDLGVRETVGERIARGHREPDDVKAGRKKSLEEGLAALSSGEWNWAPWLQRSCVFPTAELCEMLSTRICESECRGLTSIGCGTGLLEWALSFFLEEHAISCVDRRPLELQLLPEAARRVFYAQLTTDYSIAHVPRDNALLISWGELSLLTWTSYLRRYSGSCIVIITDEQDKRCSPSIKQVEQVLGVGEERPDEKNQAALHSTRVEGTWRAAVDRLLFENRVASFTWPERCLLSVFIRSL